MWKYLERISKGPGARLLVLPWFIVIDLDLRLKYRDLKSELKCFVDWTWYGIKWYPEGERIITSLSRDYCPKQGPIDIQDCHSQQVRQMQQSTGVTLFVTEETYWPMPTATGLVRCILLVVVTTTDWFVYCASSHGLPNPGYDWCVNDAHHWRSFPKNCAVGRDLTRYL